MSIAPPLVALLLAQPPMSSPGPTKAPALPTPAPQAKAIPQEPVTPPTAAASAAPEPAAPAATPGTPAPSGGSTEAAPTAPVIRETRQRFGVKAEIQVAASTEAIARPAIEAAFAEMQRIEELLGEDKATSDVARLNMAAGKELVSISPETVRVLRRGVEVGKLSQGAFAVTWMALSGLWDLSPGTEIRTLPGSDRIAERLRLVDDGKLALDDEKRTARLAEKGMAVGVAGLAQGYAIHRALNTLKKAGIHDALVFVGGDVGVIGQKGGRPWLVGIQDPRAAGYFAVLSLKDEAIAQSGDYEHFVELDGKRYHHVLDARTGLPAQLCRSAAVVAADAATADALATAVFILGPEKGMALVEGMNGVGAVIVDADNEVRVSKSLRDRVRVVRPPTL